MSAAAHNTYKKQAVLEIASLPLFTPGRQIRTVLSKDVDAR